jgi:hypothetical protein
VALEGNLKDFSLADMFRLLAKGEKTGTLHVSRDGSEARICFKDGEVIFAASAGHTDNLGKRLARAGILSDKQLRQALGLQKIQKKEKAGRRLGQILVDEGYVEQPVLEQFILDQISDTVFEVFRWDEGQLRFDADEVCEDEDIGLAVSVDALITDAEKRLDQWGRIMEKIPSMDARFAMSPAPGERPLDIHLKPREWLVLCYLHGGRSVRELVEATGFNDFETAKTLYAMLASGLIEQVGASNGTK